MEKLNRIIERFDLLRRGYSSEDIIMEFRCTEKENTLFIFMENLIERLCQLNHIGTAKNSLSSRWTTRCRLTCRNVRRKYPLCVKSRSCR